MGQNALHLHLGLREVEDEAVLAIGRAKVGADDGEVHVGDLLDRLELDDDLVADEQVEAMQSDLDASVEHRDRNLAFERDSSASHFDDERVVVDGFEEAGTELAMNGVRRADDRTRQCFVFQRHGCADACRSRD